MKKTPFVTKQQVEEIVKQFPTPFHLYDEAGIRANAQAVKDAFAWNPGFREYFAVKATPNPYLLKILKDYDMGCDCSSYTELMLAKSCGFDGEHIMFSSNDTPAEEFAYADKLGAIINLDDFTHIDFLEETIGHIPETISCRYNPGGVFTLSNGIMDNPGDSKYGMTKEQLFEAFKILKSKGAKYFGVHAFLASNTVTNEYYPQLAKELFELVVELKNETGCDIRFVNLSGGVGVAYKPDQTPNDISVIGAGVHKVYDEVLVPAGMGDVAIYTEMGRFMMAADDMQGGDPSAGAVEIYVDGSYHAGTKEFSYGMVVLINGKEEKFSQKMSDPELAQMRNVAGEIKGSEAAMQYALDHKIPSIIIYHDYQGIASWCNGDWKANKAGTIAYRDFYRKAKERVHIEFRKVKGHSNDKYNDMVDELAKEALGIH